jgi:hypothetical protein
LRRSKSRFSRVWRRASASFSRALPFFQIEMREFLSCPRTVQIWYGDLFRTPDACRSQQSVPEMISKLVAGRFEPAS